MEASRILVQKGRRVIISNKWGEAVLMDRITLSKGQQWRMMELTRQTA